MHCSVLSVDRWVERVIAQLDTGTAERLRLLRAGFRDLRQQLVRVDRREACSPRW